MNWTPNKQLHVLIGAYGASSCWESCIHLVEREQTVQPADSPNCGQPHGPKANFNTPIDPYQNFVLRL